MPRSRSPRVEYGRIIHAFIRAGWNPPRPSDKAFQRIIDDIERVHPSATLQLSGLQARCLALYAEGLTKQEIADRLDLGLETVRTRLKEAQQRLGARNMTHAVALAIRDELI